MLSNRSIGSSRPNPHSQGNPFAPQGQAQVESYSDNQYQRSQGQQERPGPSSSSRTLNYAAQVSANLELQCILGFSNTYRECVVAIPGNRNYYLKRYVLHDESFTLIVSLFFVIFPALEASWCLKILTIDKTKFYYVITTCRYTYHRSSYFSVLIDRKSLLMAFRLVQLKYRNPANSLPQVKKDHLRGDKWRLHFYGPYLQISNV